MHNIVVAEVGTFKGILTVEETQSMIFKDSDEEPFWLNEHESMTSKLDSDNGSTTKKDKTKAELLV